ncbi:MAG: long-chain-fatty-acid--CoA ligase [Pseudomonadota bacterium]
MTVNIGNFLTRRARRNPNVEAIFDTHANKRVSYDELNKRANQVAHALDAAGAKKGDRVGTLLMNGLPLVESVYASAKLGAISVALNWRLTADELEFILKDSGTSVLVYGDEFAPVVAELQARGDATEVATWIQVGGETAAFAQDYDDITANTSDAEPELNSGDDDLLYIMYTSGTTGLPKGVMHSHNNVMWAIITSSASTEYASDERFLISLPLFHVGALTPLFTNLYAGFTSVIVRSFDPEECWQLIASEKVNSTLMVPAMLLAMKAIYDPSRHDPSSLTTVVSGAAPVPVALIEDYKQLGIAINQVYGMTESCGPGCLITGEDAMARPGSTGRPYFHTDVRIVNGRGEDCAPGESGELWMKAPNNMVGYWNRPDATAETLIDGWVLSGDAAVMDEDGFITIVERIKDMLISGGENVYPAEIENVLLGHEGIADAAVIGIPSAKWGESAMAVIVKGDDSLTDIDVMSFTKGKLAGYKAVRKVEFTDTIPRNPSGKILKRELREQYEGVEAPE